MNIFNNDFKDFILYLNQYEVEYIVVGGYAVIIRGYSRSTGDIDIWVNKTEENFIKLQKAIKVFGLLE
jgi:predicted nucleotidyltransferase